MDIEHRSPALRRKRPSITVQSAILKEQNNCCAYCGMTLGEWFTHKGKPRFAGVHFDHLLPYEYCFNNDTENFVASCGDCNLIKSCKVFDSIKEIIKYVRERRRAKGLPVRKLQGPISQTQDVAEVLQLEMQNGELLEASPNSTQMNISQAAAVMGRKGRKQNTQAQKEASRQNGKRGGRPRKKVENSSCITQAPRIISHR